MATLYNLCFFPQDGIPELKNMRRTGRGFYPKGIIQVRGDLDKIGLRSHIGMIWLIFDQTGQVVLFSSVA